MILVRDEKRRGIMNQIPQKILACYVTYVTWNVMARGKSGRIVIEIDPLYKRELYATLARDNMTLKDWFVMHVGRYLRDRGQPELFDDNLTAGSKVAEEDKPEA